jgi:pimeloyl-ACP methyl ester carboxylesterase
MLLAPLVSGAFFAALGLDEVAMVFTASACALAFVTRLVDPAPKPSGAPAVGAEFAGTRVAVLDAPTSSSSRVFVFCAGIGGSIEGSARMHLIRQLRQFGKVVLHERRGFGVVRDAHIDPCFETATDDAASAAMLASSLEADRVVIVGFSLGSTPALRLAARTGMPVILVAAFADARTLPHTSWAEWAMCHAVALTNEPLAIALAPQHPVLVAHSHDDSFIEYEHSSRLLALLGPGASRCGATGDHSHPVLDEIDLMAWLARV